LFRKKYVSAMVWMGTPNFISWKLNPQIHILIAFGGETFGSWLDHEGSALMNGWIHSWFSNRLSRELDCYKSNLPLAFLFCLAMLHPSSSWRTWLDVE
jgi:hypothetical protein